MPKFICYSESLEAFRKQGKTGRQSAETAPAGRTDYSPEYEGAFKPSLKMCSWQVIWNPLEITINISEFGSSDGG